VFGRQYAGEAVRSGRHRYASLMQPQLMVAYSAALVKSIQQQGLRDAQAGSILTFLRNFYFCVLRSPSYSTYDGIYGGFRDGRPPTTHTAHGSEDHEQIA
jgi:hypothetical protein